MAASNPCHPRPRRRRCRGAEQGGGGASCTLCCALLRTVRRIAPVQYAVPSAETLTTTGFVCRAVASMVEGSAEQVRQAPSRKRPVTLSVKARRLKKRLSVCDQAALRSLCDAFCLSAVLQPPAPALLSLLPVDAAVAAEEGLALVRSASPSDLGP